MISYQYACRLNSVILNVEAATFLKGYQWCYLHRILAFAAINECSRTGGDVYKINNRYLTTFESEHVHVFIFFPMIQLSEPIQITETHTNSTFSSTQYQYQNIRVQTGQVWRIDKQDIRRSWLFGSSVQGFSKRKRWRLNDNRVGNVLKNSPPPQSLGIVLCRYGRLWRMLVSTWLWFTKQCWLECTQCWWDQSV